MKINFLRCSKNFHHFKSTPAVKNRYLVHHVFHQQRNFNGTMTTIDF